MTRLDLRWLAIALALLGACAAEEVKNPPDALVDTWHSQAPRLSGRSLEIRSDFVLFGASRFKQAMHPLLRVEQERRGGGTHYTLFYRGEGHSERQLGFVYRKGQPDTLQLDHHDEIWVRRKDANWLKEEAS